MGYTVELVRLALIKGVNPEALAMLITGHTYDNRLAPISACHGDRTPRRAVRRTFSSSAAASPRGQ